MGGGPTCTISVFCEKEVSVNRSDRRRRRSEVTRFQESMIYLPLHLLRFRTVILRLIRRRRVFVMGSVAFESIRDLAEKALLFLGGIPIRLDTACRLRVPTVSRRRERPLGIAAKNPRKESLHAAALIASIMRFRPRDEGNRVSVRTGRSCQPIGNLVESHIHHALGLVEGPYIGILGQRNRLFHELRPDGRGRL